MGLIKRHPLQDLMDAIDAMANAEEDDRITYKAYQAAIQRVADEKAKIPGAETLVIKRLED